MKLSTLSTERALDVLCEITPYVASMMGDKHLLDTLAKKLDMSGASVAEIYVNGANKIAEIAPIMLKDHREDVLGILAVLNECDVKQIKEQNIIQTMKQVKEAAQDKELIDFFKSWQQQEPSEP